MKTLIYLVIICALVNAAWRTILKKGAYPSCVKLYIKWFHAGILCYLQLYFLCAVGNLGWLLHSNFGTVGSVPAVPAYVSVHILGSVTGLPLPIICEQMAKRRTNSLKWYFTAWPINFVCETYIMIASVNGKYPSSSIMPIIIIFCCPFIASIVFYLIPPIRNNLFECEKVAHMSPMTR